MAAAGERRGAALAPVVESVVCSALGHTLLPEGWEGDVVERGSAEHRVRRDVHECLMDLKFLVGASSSV